MIKARQNTLQRAFTRNGYAEAPPALTAALQKANLRSNSFAWNLESFTLSFHFSALGRYLALGALYNWSLIRVTSCSSLRASMGK